MNNWSSFANRFREAFRARYLLIFGTAVTGGYLCAEFQSTIHSQDAKTFVFAGFLLIVGCLAASIRQLFP